MTQLTLTPLYAPRPNTTGPERRDAGIRRATKRADELDPGWKDRARDFFETYARSHERFQTEDVRMAFEAIWGKRIHGRAWGGIAMGAASRGVVRKIGAGPVENPRAHCANAAEWESCLKGDFDAVV